jgi:hypothetical protein
MSIRGITVSSYPTAAGNQLWLICHDSQRTRGFHCDEIRTVEVES